MVFNLYSYRQVKGLALNITNFRLCIGYLKKFNRFSFIGIVLYAWFYNRSNYLVFSSFDTLYIYMIILLTKSNNHTLIANHYFRVQLAAIERFYKDNLKRYKAK